MPGAFLLTLMAQPSNFVGCCVTLSAQGFPLNFHGTTINFMKVVVPSFLVNTDGTTIKLFQAVVPR
jgi:hypothetical protein